VQVGKLGYQSSRYARDAWISPFIGSKRWDEVTPVEASEAARDARPPDRRARDVVAYWRRHEDSAADIAVATERDGVWKPELRFHSATDLIELRWRV
jgi:hypothetical protein